MACSHILSFFVLTTLVLFILISPSESILEGGDVYAAKPQKVNLNLYYQALCPSCPRFITYDLVKVFQTDLNTIVNLRLVPWGNAQVINGTIVCQNGENECFLNIIHACAIKAWPTPIKHFVFIACTEANPHSRDVETTWRECAKHLGLPQKPIENCYNRGEGEKLSLGYGNETDHLKPPLEYVPWVTVNGVPIKLDYPNYIRYVCKAYKGKPIKACKSSLSSSTLKEISTNPVRYAEQSRNSPFLAAENSKQNEPEPPA